MAKKKTKEEAKEEKKGGKLKLIIIILLALGLLGGGGFFAYKFFLAPKPEEAKKVEETQAQSKEEGKQEVKEEGESVVYSLPAFIVNLADPLGRRYLKLSLDIEVKNQKVVEEVDKKLPQIKDSIILLLSSKSFTDIDTMEEKLALKTEIMARLTQILGQGKVIRVYFTEMVVQ